jgi:copper transport protein
MLRRMAAAGILLLLLFERGTPVAFAHATLAKADPPPNSILATGPRQVTLWLDEPVDLTFSSVQVLDGNRVRVDHDDLSAAPRDPREVHVTLKELVDGTYIVTWKVLSASDGHLTRGVFAFGVGAGVADAGLPSPAPHDLADTNAISVIARALELWSLLVLIGAIFFRELLLIPSLRRVGAEPSLVDARWRRLILAALVGASLGALSWLAIQSILVTGALTAEGIAQVLYETRVGIVWIVRLALVGLLSFLLLRIRPRVSALFAASMTAALVVLYFGGLGNDLSPIALGRLAQAFVTSWSAGGVVHHLLFFLLPAIVVFLVGAFQEEKTRRFVIGIAAPALILTISLSGHSAAQGDASLAILVDGLHLTAVAFWVGGLATLAWVIAPVWRGLPPERRREWLSWLLPQFSRIALSCVGVIVVTGLYTSLVQVGSVAALLDTLYGQVLSSKVVLFLLMLPLGGLNLFVITRGLARAGTASIVARWYRVFRTALSIELMLGAAIIALAGVLTLTPPARGTNAGSVATLPLVLIGSPAPDLNVALTISPTLDTARDFDAVVQDAAGRPAPNVLRLILEFTWLDEQPVTTRVPVDTSENGHYRVAGDYLPLPGKWTVRVIVRRKGVEDVDISFPVFRSANGSRNTGLGPRRFSSADAPAKN